MQVIVQATAIGHTEETRGQTLQLAGAQRLVAAALLMATVEQPIDVLLDVTLAATHRLGVAEQEQNTCPRLEVAARDVMQQAIEQFDRRCLVAVDTGGKQQVQPVVPRLRRPHFQRTLTQPAHPHAFDRQLSLLRRFTTGEGQFKQFAEGEHSAVFLDQ